MCAAEVHISEWNGAGPEASATKTDSISNSNYVNADAANAVAADNPITPNAGGAYKGSFQKYQKIHVVAFGGISKVKNIKFWRVQGSPTSGDKHKSNATTSSYANKTYETPTTSLLTFSTTGAYDVQSAEPSGANIGVNSLTANEITSTTSSYSDFIWHQVWVSAATTAGSVLTLRYQWDEVA